jgi:hypothetical protein
LGINTNADFSGDYHLNENANLHILWGNWLNALHKDSLVIMCHVAMPNQSGEKNRSGLSSL